MINVGGCGGFLASVLAMGVTGQQQHGSSVSAEVMVLGGAGGGVRFSGGGTNPSSSDPSPVPKTVPVHNVKNINPVTKIFSFMFFLFI